MEDLRDDGECAKKDARCLRAKGEMMQEVFILGGLIFNMDKQLWRFAMVSISDSHILTYSALEIVQ